MDINPIICKTLIINNLSRINHLIAIYRDLLWLACVLKKILTNSWIFVLKKYSLNFTRANEV